MKATLVIEHSSYTDTESYVGHEIFITGNESYVSHVLWVMKKDLGPVVRSIVSVTSSLVI